MGGPWREVEGPARGASEPAGGPQVQLGQSIGRLCCILDYIDYVGIQVTINLSFSERRDTQKKHD